MRKRKSDMSVDLGFEDVDSHSQPLTYMDLIELE
jgi:hypothetical protein